MKKVEPSPRQSTVKRLPVYGKDGWLIRGGDFFKVTGRNNWWRFVAYVIPVRGDGYVECVELKEKGEGVGTGERPHGTPKHGGVRCIDGGTVREVKSHG